MKKFSTILLTILLTCLVPQLMSYQYQLSIMAIFKNEADYLKEWIDYHHRVGVEHFILFNHNSDDHYLEVLKPYLESKLVEVHDWKQVEFPAAQIEAFKVGIKLSKKKTKWLAVIDIDEFIVPIKDDDIRLFLKDYEEFAGVVANWQIFGTSDIHALPPGEWITKHLIYKFPAFFDDPSWNSNHFVKSIIRPDRINANSTNPNCGNHIFKPIESYKIVNSNKESIPIECRTDEILVDKIQINHYWFRTISWFYERKLDLRGLVGEKYTPEKIEYLFQEGKSEIDLQIQRFLD